MLPVFFIVLASAALLAALTALFASLRATLGGAGVDEAGWGVGQVDLGALEDEKNALLRALKDLEYEHEVGKIDDEDYARLERAYRARAKVVLGELDRDLRPYLERAEELALGGAGNVDKKKAKKDKKKKAAVAAPSEPKPEIATATESEPEGERKGEPESEGEGEPAGGGEGEGVGEANAAPVCPKCSTTNDVDARFCKKCATPLATAEASS